MQENSHESPFKSCPRYTEGSDRDQQSGYSPRRQTNAQIMDN
ncbi:unnamed protein product [Nezara viridula]|uniref:Uncharacterized protein n=1 Tax=Nezara viridula TaxID=85310 RepID=A0A9P0HAJ5_NEZVI|nr:unnamed protein product [Nezara viridula]